MLGPYINAEQIYSRPLSAHDNSKTLICKKEREEKRACLLAVICRGGQIDERDAGIV
jgi:hypothetical protein